MTTPGTYGGISIVVERESLADHYLISPNAMHRGEGVYAGMSLRGRGMLAALLSVPNGWEASREAIEAFAPELGRTAIDTVFEELRTRKHLATRKFRRPDGTYAWSWRVSMLPMEDVDDVPAAPTRRKTAGRTIRRSPGDGRIAAAKPQVAPYAGDPPMADPDMGHPNAGDPDDKEVPLLEEPPTYQPSAVPAPAAAVERGSEGGQPESSTPDPLADAAVDALDAVLATAGARRRPGKGKRAELVAEISAALRDGWTGAALVRQLADGWDGVRDVGAAIRYRLRDLPPAPSRPQPPSQRGQRCDRHPVYAAAGCPACATDSPAPDVSDRAAHQAYDPLFEQRYGRRRMAAVS